ncbi:MAG: LCP family protein [Anaerolineales bacterium]|nr:LCP family protein [Anaerolineales bacterium]
MQKRKPPKIKIPPPNLKAILAAGVVFLIYAVIFVPTSFNSMHDIGESGASAGWKLFSPKTKADGGDNPEVVPTQQDTTLFGEFPEGMPMPESWNGSDRVTVLLMGLDYRDWEAGSSASRTDTMILLSVDPITKTAGMLSIPRDLWAVIPGFNPGKINTAYYYGEAYKVPGGGPALAMKTVEQTIGVPIDYYAQVDFEAFERFIDMMGGLKMDIPYAIKVDPVGPKQPRYLQPGVQTLPGDLVLAYARNRYTENGDFDRAARQQQVILAIRDRIINFNMLPDLIANAPEIYAELSSGIDTNLSLEDVIKLAVLASQIPKEDIKTGIIDQRYVTFGTSPDQLSILIPIPDRIRTLRDEIFATSGPYAPMTPGDAQKRMELEFASISIQNGTSNGSLGEQTADYLRDIGANVAEITSAETGYGQTTVIDHSGKPYTLQFLVDEMGVNPNNIQHDYDPNSRVDIELKLGGDWARALP